MTLAHAGNMLGALMLVGIAACAGMFHDAPSGAMYYATYKTSHSFLEVADLSDLSQVHDDPFQPLMGWLELSCHPQGTCNHERAATMHFLGIAGFTMEVEA